MKKMLRIICVCTLLLNPFSVWAEASSLDQILAILGDILAAEQEIAKYTGPDLTISEELPANSVARYAKQTDQDVVKLLDETTAEWTALKAIYYMADTDADSDKHQWSDSTAELNALLSATGSDSTKFSGSIEHYSGLFPLLTDLTDPKTEELDPSTLVNANYTQEGNTYRAALATSQYMYNNINTRISKIHELLGEVDTKSVNPKAAIDLNTRLVAELAYVQLEMLKMQSVQMQMEASKNQGELNTDSLEKQFLSYDVSESLEE